MTGFGLPQRFGGAGLHALVAEDALRGVFPPPRFAIDLHIHGAGPQAPAAMDAGRLVTVDPQQCEIAHGLEEYRDGAEVLAERAVVPQGKG